MSDYINPPELVRKVGRKLEGDSFAHLSAELKDDEILTALCDMSTYLSAPHLDSAETFDVFQDRSKFEGTIVGFYAVRRQDAEGHLDISL